MLAACSARTAVVAHVVPVSAKTTWVMLELRLGDVVGWGEITDFGNEAAIIAEVAAVDAAFAQSSPSSLGEALGFIAGRQVSNAGRVVRSGLEQAFLDAQGRRAGQSAAALLGGPYRAAVPVYANINRGIAAGRMPGDFAAQARLAIEDGYRAIKIAPFDGVHWQSADGLTERRRPFHHYGRLCAVSGGEQYGSDGWYAH